MNLVEISCRKCGGKLNEDGTGKYKCSFCNSVFYEDHLQREIEMLSSILDNAKQEKLANLRKLLWKELHKEYTDSREIVSLCKEIKKIYPEDFYANLYEALNNGIDEEVCDFLDNIDEEEYYEDIPDILSFMIKSLKSAYLMSVSDLIERTYGSDRNTYEKYMTEYEREAEKVEQGVYDPTQPRDAFIMYSSADMPKVKSLTAFLESQGLSCFVAARNLQHGRGAVADYQRSLETAMDNCKVIVFVSSSNSRSMKCDVIRLEMPYIKSKDLSRAPAEYGDMYEKIPDKYKKPRVEYVIESYTGKNIVERRTKEFFGTLQWAQSEDAVAERVMEILLSKPEIEDENAKILAALQEAEARRKKEEEQRRKEAEEAEARRQKEEEQRRKEAAEAEARRKREAEEAEARRKKEEEQRRKEAAEAEARRRKEAEEAEERRRAEIEELRRSFEEQLKQQRAAVPTAPTSSTAPIATTVAIPAEGNISGLCRRADDYLARGDWQKVDEYGEKILDINLDDPQGYIYKLLAEYKVKTKEELEKVDGNFPESQNYICAVERGESGLTLIAERQKERKEIERKAREEVERKEAVIRANFRIENGALKKYLGKGGDVVIPDRITSIGESAFEQSKVTSVVIPNSVTSIGERAFSKCDSLSRVTIPESVTSIGALAFAWCHALKSVEIKKGLTVISSEVFSCCTSLTSVIIPDSVFIIGNWAFFNCQALTSIVIPESVTSIGKEAFKDCTAIKSILIHKRVRSIGESAFSGWTKDQSVYCEYIKSYSNSFPKGWNKDTFVKCEAKVVWGYNEEVAESIAKEEAARKEAERKAKEEAARKEAERIAQEEAARKEAERIVKEHKAQLSRGFEIENGVLINYGGAGGEVVIPDGVTSIGELAFDSCDSLTSVKIPDGVTSIGEMAFDSCHSLTSVKIPDSVTSIGDNAFSECDNLESVEIPDSVTELGSGLFSYCHSLTSVKMPDGLNEIGQEFFKKCNFLSNVTIPESVTSIENNAFEGCTALKNIIIPKNVTSIGSRAFGSCRSLVSVTLPDSLSRIGNNAFENCTSLKSIVIPINVGTIQKGAFYGWKETQTIYFECKKPLFGLPKWLDSDAFDYCKAKIVWGYKK